MTTTTVRNSPSGSLVDVTGATGPFGGAVSLPYIFRSDTSGTPGSGQLEVNQAAQNTATLITASTTDADGANVDAVLASMNTATNPTKGFIRLATESDPTRWLLFSLTSVGALIAGRRTLTVVPVTASSVSPLADLTLTVLCFTQDGNTGATGPAPIMAPNTLYGNPTAAPATPVDIAVGGNTVVGRVAGNLLSAQLVTAQIALGQITNPVLAQMAANTVKVNATAALADAQDFAIGTNTVLGRVAGNIVAAPLVTAQIAVNQVTNAVLAQMAANTVKVNATAAPANATDTAIGTNTVLGRVAGNIVAAGLVTEQLAAAASSRAVSFSIGPISLAATGAAADDVIVFNANAPRAFLIIRMVPIITVGQLVGTVVARNATGGSGAPVSSTFGATLASDAPAITANLGLTQSIAAGGTLVVRRNNGNIQGEVFFDCMPL